MTQARYQTRVGENYTAADLGPFEKLNQYRFSHEGLSFEIEGKVFLNHLLKLTSAEVSLNRFPSGAGRTIQVRDVHHRWHCRQ